MLDGSVVAANSSAYCMVTITLVVIVIIVVTNGKACVAIRIIWLDTKMH